jgi:hypothetical protein
LPSNAAGELQSSGGGARSALVPRQRP